MQLYMARTCISLCVIPSCYNMNHRVTINDDVLPKTITWGNPVVRCRITNVDNSASQNIVALVVLLDKLLEAEILSEWRTL